MKRILITGATGNIGTEVVNYLCELENEHEIIAALRNVDAAKNKFPDYPKLAFKDFNFENPDSFKVAFKDIDLLFLLRPPQISEVDKDYLHFSHSPSYIVAFTPQCYHPY